MTLGLTNRGSEVVIDEIATSLSTTDKVLVLQSGPITNKKYQVERVYPMDDIAPSSPTNLLTKIKFKLKIDSRSKDVSAFTRASLSYLKSFDPDLVVVVNGGNQLSIVRASMPNVKTVVFGHAGIGHDDLYNLQNKPDLFVALSEKAFEWASLHKENGTKVVFINNPIDLSKYKHAKPHDFGMPSPIVITVSALSSYKNVIDVIEAVRKLPVSYVLIGDGEESDKVANALSSLANEFRWIKDLPSNELGSYYSGADVFCFAPDPQESFGRVYLEAMASGLPIVASDDSVRRTIVGKSGYYASVHDVTDISTKIVEAVKKGRISYADILKNYDLKFIVKMIRKEFSAL